MSWQAVSWANEQPTESPAAHLVLVQLANIAGHDGVVRRLDIDYLARVSKQSRASVFRRLREFEKGGVLSRETVGHTETGAAVVGARLHTDRTLQAMQETQGGDEAEAVDNEGRQSQIETAFEGGQSHPEHEAVSPSETASLYAKRNEVNNIPPYPPTDGKLDEGERERDDLEAQFEKFKRSYPFDASMRISEARKAFEPLSLKDRARAIRWAAAYAADLERRGATRPVDAARWLRERRFDDVEAVKDGRAKAAGLMGSRVFVAKGTRAWDAWVSRGHKPGLTCGSGPAGDSRVGWWFPSLWPPGVDPPAAVDGETGCGVGG